MEMDAANTVKLWIGITVLVIAIPCFIAHYLKLRRYYSQYSRKNERQLYATGTRIDFTRDYK